VVSGAGVRAFMVPKRRKLREAQKAKLRRGTGGRKVDT
jgi:hypothetical protein